MTDREQRSFELPLVQLTQKIGLIFLSINSGEKMRNTVFVINPACVMTGGDTITAEFVCLLQKKIEFHVLVAQHIRVRRAPRPILVDHVFVHLAPILRFKIKRIKLQSQLPGNTHGIPPLPPPFACFSFIVRAPILHESTNHLVSLLKQQYRRHTTIDPTTHSEENFSF